MSRDNASSTTPSIEQRARQRVALKTGFLFHALIFVLVNGGLYLMSQFGTWGDGRWHGRMVGLPIWGWGLGLAIHGIVVLLKLQGDGMKERMVEREIEAIKRREVGGGR